MCRPWSSMSSPVLTIATISLGIDHCLQRREHPRGTDTATEDRYHDPARSAHVVRRPQPTPSRARSTVSSPDAGRPGRVEGAALHLALPGRPGSARRARRLRHELVEPRAPRSPCRSRCSARGRRRDVPPGRRRPRLVDIDVVARLAAVPEDRCTGARASRLPAKIATTPASPCGSWRGP